MKPFNLILTALILFFCYNASNAQPWFTTGNTITAAEFFGASAASTVSLRVEHKGTANINFYTGTPSVQRMTILGTGAGVVNAGNVGIGVTTPDMPLHIMGTFPFPSANALPNGWARGIHLQNHSALVWDIDNGANYLLMGHPSIEASHSFYCGLAPNLSSSTTINYAYRIVDIPIAGQTSLTAGDAEFFHSALVNGSVGVGLNTNTTTVFNPTNRLEINTTAFTGGGAPVILPPNGSSGAGVSNGFSGTGFSGLRFTDLRSTSTPRTNPGTGVLALDANGDVIYVPGGTGTVNAANNGTSLSGGNTVVLGNNVSATSGQLLTNRELPMNGKTLIFTQVNPDDFSFGKVGFGIPPGNIGFNALRTSNVTMQVNGSISIFDGIGGLGGSTSLFLGEEHVSSPTPGEWGMQYTTTLNGSPTGNGLNFWKPFGSTGAGFGNNFLFLSDNGNISMGSAATTAPGNVLTIKSYPSSPQPAGLRFTNLPSTSATVTNPGLGVLSVDPNGDVILVPANPGFLTNANNGTSVSGGNTVQWGNDLLGTAANLLNDRELNMSGFNAYFKNQFADANGIKNAIGIGYNITSPGAYLPAKLSVFENHGTPIAYPSVASTSPFYNTYAGSTGISGITKDVVVSGSPFPAINLIGVYGESSGNEPGSNKVIHCGGRFFAANAQNNFGVEAIADGSHSSGNQTAGGKFTGFTTSSIGVVAGVDANVDGTSIGPQYYAGRFTASAPIGSVQYGVFANAPVSPTSWAGYFSGDINVTGISYANNHINTSDQQFKTDIDTIANASQIIAQLTPRTFFFDTTNTHGFHFSNERQYGFVAQEVETVLPELVVDLIKPTLYDTAGNVVDTALNYKGLNYDGMIALLMKGMQEQQTVIQNLTTQVNDLTAAVNNCCSQGNSLTNPNNNSNQTVYNVNNIDVKLGENDCVLNVNSPNPFRDNTTIGYLIPENAKFAQIIFYNSLGQAIKIVDINDKGQGRLNVYGEDLRSGMYSYSLIIDGNVCETHKMIRE